MSEIVVGLVLGALVAYLVAAAVIVAMAAWSTREARRRDRMFRRWHDGGP